MRSGLLTLYRSLTRHRLYSVLNVGGLALGIAVFLVLFLFVRFETGFDRRLPGSDKLWIVQRTLSFPGVPTVEIPTPIDMLANLRADYPQTVGTRMRSADVAVLIGQFMRPVLVANVIAWPLAWLLARQWLTNFDDRVALSPWFFIGAFVVAAGVAVLTITGQAWRVARAALAAALRYE